MSPPTPHPQWGEDWREAYVRSGVIFTVGLCWYVSDWAGR